MKNKLKNIANMPKYGYSYFALSKISKLALTGYKFSLGVQSARAFFVRNFSMRPHIYVELGRDTFGCAGNLVSLSVNLLKLHTNQMTVMCEAPLNTLGAHSHA